MEGNVKYFSLSNLLGIKLMLPTYNTYYMLAIRMF